MIQALAFWLFFGVLLAFVPIGINAIIQGSFSAAIIRG